MSLKQLPPLVLLLLFPVSPERAVLEVEDARAENPSAILEALESSDARIQRLAVRALGRLERPQYTDAVLPLLMSPNTAVRMEAFNALGQMRSDVDLRPFLPKEKDGAVRGVIYETIGRLHQADEAALVAGLEDDDPRARTGAAKGLEAFLRETRAQPAPETLRVLRKAVRVDNPAKLKELALLALNRAEDRDVETLSAALESPAPLVRRLAVMGLETPKEDPSFMVRYESLRFEEDCGRLRAAVGDSSGHVGLLAIDRLGELGCPDEALAELVSEGKDWRFQARALVALAKVSPEKARSRISGYAGHATWQVRAYAAEAAKILHDEATLARLLEDPHPRVVSAALEKPADAVRALTSEDYGLLMVATGRLEGWSEGARAVPALLDALERVTRDKRATSRDPRRRLLERLREFGDAGIVPRLRPLLEDFDPVVAKLAAEIISEKGRTAVEPKTLRFETRPVPPQAFMDGLKRARARIKMKEAGTFVIELLPEEAPVTVARFAGLVEEGYYNGLTFHRIVPNFVIQGGSPGANEFVGTPGYIRDELGLLSHERGTLGISTRGRDTGDSQIFVNLVDNFRLDHNYTVFARVIEGMDNVDRILEGDVMESVEILRDDE
jgi:cyclophilin family peptidyl-prolyl cis-trans isomerase/HEAT repeat protein